LKRNATANIQLEAIIIGTAKKEGKNTNMCKFSDGGLHKPRHHLLASHTNVGLMNMS